jgi:predicted alpha/beta-fold hydrolase
LTTFQKEDLVSAEVLADQISQKLGEAFKSLVTAQGLIETLERLVEDKQIDYRSPEHKAEMREGLRRLRSVKMLDEWEIDHASSGAASVKGVLGAARFAREHCDD